MEITTGKQKHPVKAVLYGPEGIGKSTAASLWPKPVFIDVEKGTGQLEIARTPAPTSWAMLQQIIAELPKHDFKTLVLDTADWLDKLAQAHICAKANKTGIEDFGYGKGYTFLAEEWKRFLDTLNDLQEKTGMNILFLAHAQMRKFEQPDEMGAYDRFELKMEKKSSSLLKEWADMLLFCNYRTIVVENDGKKKAQGGERVIYTVHHNNWDAKSRFDLPEVMLMKKELPKELAAILNEATVAYTPKTVSQPVTQKAPPAPKKEEPKKEPVKEPETKKDDIPMESKEMAPHLKKLKDLMEADKVTVKEIQTAVSKRGVYTIDTPISVYDPKYVEGCLIAAWEKVKAAVIANRAQA